MDYFCSYFDSNSLHIYQVSLFLSVSHLQPFAQKPTVCSPWPIGILHSVIFHPWNHRRAQYLLASTQLTYQHPLSNVPVPLPAPLYPCCLPWTVILKRHDIDRHINQQLSITLPPMPSSSKATIPLQWWSRITHFSFPLLDRQLKPSYKRPPWCSDLSHLIKLLHPFLSGSQYWR